MDADTSHQTDNVRNTTSGAFSRASYTGFLFRCSPTPRILKRLGAEPGPGGALVLAKDVFLERVRQYLADDRVAFERRRRERLEQALDALNPHTRARLVKVIEEDRPADALALLSSRFGQLPEGVELTRHSLHIEFRGREQFLARLGAVLFALENDTDKVLAFLERAADPG